MTTEPKLSIKLTENQENAIRCLRMRGIQRKFSLYAEFHASAIKGLEKKGLIALVPDENPNPFYDLGGQFQG